jgi:hypothetical protein
LPLRLQRETGCVRADVSRCQIIGLGELMGLPGEAIGMQEKTAG